VLPGGADGRDTVETDAETATDAPARSAPSGTRYRRTGPRTNAAKRITPSADVRDHAATGTPISGSISTLNDRALLGAADAGV
jgi:hypothetical protein